MSQGHKRTQREVKAIERFAVAQAAETAAREAAAAERAAKRKLEAAEKAQTVATIEGELCRLECEKAYEDWQVLKIKLDCLFAELWRRGLLPEELQAELAQGQQAQQVQQLRGAAGALTGVAGAAAGSPAAGSMVAVAAAAGNMQDSSVGADLRSLGYESLADYFSKMEADKAECAKLHAELDLAVMRVEQAQKAMHAGSAPGAEVAAADKDPATAAAASSTAALAAATGSRQPGMSPLQLSGSAEFQAHGNFAPANRASYLQKLAAYSAECALLQAGSDGDILAAEEVQQVTVDGAVAGDAFGEADDGLQAMHGGPAPGGAATPAATAAPAAAEGARHPRTLSTAVAARHTRRMKPLGDMTLPELQQLLAARLELAVAALWVDYVLKPSTFFGGQRTTDVSIGSFKLEAGQYQMQAEVVISADRQKVQLAAKQFECGGAQWLFSSTVRGVGKQQQQLTVRVTGQKTAQAGDIAATVHQAMLTTVHVLVSVYVDWCAEVPESLLDEYKANWPKSGH